MPRTVPLMPESFFQRLDKMTFVESSCEVATALISDAIPSDKLRDMVAQVLTFDAPLQPISSEMGALELFHGPTLAFKDFGARFMARLMGYFLEANHETLTVLVATSGDTGSAVANGFYKVPGIVVKILYPSGKVSAIQEKQLTTLGFNIEALEVAGSFDDCQALVKRALADEALNGKMLLTTANSINIARLLPQTFYYFSAYRQFKRSHGDKPFVVSVPSGNFGNLTAGLLAKKMGLPIAHFIAATNINDVVPEYLKTGVLRTRPSKATLSNAMDVGNPSNFARMSALYEGSLERLRGDLTGYAFTDAETREAIVRVYQEFGYLLDPHGAIGYLGLKRYLTEQAPEGAGAFLATAHPCKFLDVVEPLIQDDIKIPKRLVQTMRRDKVATPMDRDYAALVRLLSSQL